MKYTVEEQLQIVLGAAELMTPARYDRLLAETGGAVMAWERIKTGNAPAFLGERLAADLKRCASRDYFADFFGTLAEKNITALCRDSAEYPARLRAVEDSPTVLFAKGDLSVLNRPCAALVGSRRCTRYGREVADEFARDFARAGVTVISGMARGVDGAAHQAALEAGGATAAVLGTGVDVPYPAEHRELYETIVQTGLVLSEFPLGAQAKPDHFPRRNRIISGLSDAVVVMEAGEKSGALITAQLALRQGRELFAVPGNINSPASIGSNRLIAEGIPAALSAEAVLNAMGLYAAPVQEAAAEEITLSSQEKQLVAALLEEDLDADELTARLKISPQEITSLLTMLELRGIVYRAEGKIFAVNRKKITRV